MIATATKATHATPGWERGPINWMNAPTGPVRVIRPGTEPTRMSGMDQLNRQITHETMKAPPPCSATMRGKRQMFPVPTAMPSMVNIISHREEKLSCFVVMQSASWTILASLRRWWVRVVSVAQPASAEAVEEINNQAGQQPVKEAFPRDERQLAHQPDAGDDRSERHPRHERGAEGPRAVRIGFPQNPDARRHEHERKERPDVAQLHDFVDVAHAGKAGNQDARENRRHVRRAKARMHPCRPGGQQAVARHG